MDVGVVVIQCSCRVADSTTAVQNASCTLCLRHLTIVVPVARISSLRTTCNTTNQCTATYFTRNSDVTAVYEVVHFASGRLCCICSQDTTNSSLELRVCRSGEGCLRVVIVDITLILEATEVRAELSYVAVACAVDSLDVTYDTTNPRIEGSCVRRCNNALDIHIDLINAILDIGCKTSSDETTCREWAVSCELTISIVSELVTLDSDLTCGRAVRNQRFCNSLANLRCAKPTSQRANIRTSSLVDVYIAEVQTLNICSQGVEQRSVQALDCVTITVEGCEICSAISTACRLPVDRGPVLTGHIYVSNQQSIGCISRASLVYCSSKALQRLLVANNVDVSVWSIDYVVAKLAHLAYRQRLAVARLNCSVHHATISIVQSNVKLVVNTCWNCKVEVGCLARELNTLTKRILDNLLRSSSCSELACSEVERELTCDRCAVCSRNLSKHELVLTNNAHLQNTCEVIHRNALAILAVAIHCRSTIREGTLNIRLLSSEDYLTCISSRISDAIRGLQLACHREGGNCRASLICVQRSRSYAINRNLVALAPVEWIEIARLLAELCTRLLERDCNCSLGTAIS